MVNTDVLHFTGDAGTFTVFLSAKAIILMAKSCDRLTMMPLYQFIFRSAAYDDCFALNFKMRSAR
jgi:hypothetical protein